MFRIILAMEPLTILYIVLAALLALYILGLIYCFFAILDFRGRLKKRIAALSVLFGEKKDVLMSLADYYRKADLDLTDEDNKALALVASTDCKNVKEKEAQEIHDMLSSFEKRLTYLGASNAWIRRGDEYQSLAAVLSDLDANYRRIVAIYNSDLVGYEYWRKTPLYRLWLYLLGFRKKKRLN
jgi:hypothetical protein